MKKFLIALIFLIPVIVVVAIQGTGAVIEAWAPAVNAENIEIRDSFNDYIGGGRIIIPRYFNDGSDGSEYIYINVYPSVAYSDEIDYVVSAEEGYDGECQLVHVSKTKYKLIAKKSGSVLMKIFSVTNNNAYKMLNVYITSELVTEINIFADDGESVERVIEDDTIDLTEQMRLYAYAYPAEAIGQNFTVWESADPTIATVDENGVVTATGKGRTKITCWLKDKTGTEHFSFIHVNVEEDIILKQHQLYLEKAFFSSLDEHEQKEFILKNVVNNYDKYDDLPPLTTNDIVRTFADDDFMNFEVDGIPLRIDLLDDYDAIMLKSGYLSEIYIENGGYTLIPRYKDFRRKDIPKVNYVVSDPSILSVENGRIIAKKEGVCSVYAEQEGRRTDAVNLTVRTRVISFQLNLSNFDNNRGIKQERVWGQHFLEDGKLTNTFDLGYDAASVHPAAKDFELLWEVDNQFAEIDQKGKITFLDGCANQTINVTATAMVHGIRTALNRRYTFLMADEGTINIDSIEEMEQAYSEAMGKRPVALQNDILVADGRETKVNNNLYGNGYMFDVQYGGESIYSYALWVRDGDFNADSQYYILENFTVQCAPSFEEGLRRGNGICLENMKIDGTVRYVISRYSWNSMHVICNKGVLKVEGCILGTAGFAAIYFTDDYLESEDEKGTMIIKNTVMRETKCASLVTTPRDFQMDNKKNYVANVVFEGFLDSYNWRKVEELQGIFDAIDSSMLGPLEAARDFLSRLLGSLLEAYFSKEPYKSAVYTDSSGQRWVSMNMFALGLCQTVDPNSFDFTKNSEFYLVPVKLNSSEAWLIKGILKKDMDLPCYLLSYKFDETRGPVIKPQDNCPENEELFDRLHPVPEEQ